MNSRDKINKIQERFLIWKNKIFDEYHRDPLLEELDAFIKLLESEGLFEGEDDKGDIRHSMKLMCGLSRTQRNMSSEGNKIIVSSD